jgi:hypothetical protein
MSAGNEGAQGDAVESSADGDAVGFGERSRRAAQANRGAGTH